MHDRSSHGGLTIAVNRAGNPRLAVSPPAVSQLPRTDLAGRGRAVVADVGGHVAGYALLVPFWSNELGGEVCQVDELYVRPEGRSEGVGSALFAAIDAGRFGSFTATALGVTLGNARARRLYERLGFRAVGTTMLRRRARPGAAGTP